MTPLFAILNDGPPPAGAAKWGRWLRAAAARELNWPRTLWYLAGAAFVSSGLGILVGVKFILPALDAAAALPAWAWVRGQRRAQGAAFALLFWGFWKTVATAFFTILLPSRAEAAVAFGAGYTDHMLLWLRTGEALPELGWLLIAKAALAVAAASLLTGGIGGLVACALLVNCQAYFFGSLFLRTVAAWRVLAFGWPVWYIFLALGLANILVATAEPLAVRMWRSPPAMRDAAYAVVVALLMFAAAALAQSYLAPIWQEQLAPALIFDVDAVLGT